MPKTGSILAALFCLVGGGMAHAGDAPNGTATPSTDETGSASAPDRADGANANSAEQFALRRFQTRIADYPAACPPEEGKAPRRASADLSFTVAASGRATSIVIEAISDACFADAAMAALRTSLFLDAARRPGIEPPRQFRERIEFDSGTLAIAYFDPVDERFPPVYPAQCMQQASSLEMVALEFDITSGGTTTNIRIADSTMPCLNDAASSAVARWTYDPAIIALPGFPTKDVDTVTTFQLMDYDHKRAVRSGFSRRMMDLRMARRAPASQTLATLAQIETEFGKDFSPDESRTFYLARARARVANGDRAGAFDDYSAVQLLPAWSNSWKKIQGEFGPLRKETPFRPDSKVVASELTPR